MILEVFFFFGLKMNFFRFFIFNINILKSSIKTQFKRINKGPQEKQSLSSFRYSILAAVHTCSMNANGLLIDPS